MSGAVVNPLGVHALVWVGGFSREECRVAVQSTAKAGYDVLEIPALDPDSIDVADTAAVLRDHGLRGVCSLGLDLDADISSHDAAVVVRGEQRLQDALSVVSGIGGDYVGGVLYSAMAKYDRPPTAAGRANLVGALQRLASRAFDLGVTVGLEVVNRYESNVVNTAAQAVELIDEIGARNVVVHLDSYHANIEETSMAAAVTACGRHLGYVHIGESHRGYLGSGSVDFDGLFDALKTSGYTGTVTFESFSSAVVSPDLSNRLGIWRNLWDDGMDLAVHAREFITNRL